MNSCILTQNAYERNIPSQQKEIYNYIPLITDIYKTNQCKYNAHKQVEIENK